MPLPRLVGGWLVGILRLEEAASLLQMIEGQRQIPLRAVKHVAQHIVAFIGGRMRGQDDSRALPGPDEPSLREQSVCGPRLCVGAQAVGGGGVLSSWIRRGWLGQGRRSKKTEHRARADSTLNPSPSHPFS